MNTAATTHEAILKECRQLVMRDGLSAVNMRSVASACGIALGSLYNYYPSKAALVSATVESVWNDIFSAASNTPPFQRFPQAVRWLYDSLLTSATTYPGFFSLHAFGFAVEDRKEGRQMMSAYFNRIKQWLLHALESDAQVPPGTFNRGFTAQQMIDLLFVTVISLVLRREEGIDPLMEVLQRTIYER